MPEADGPVSPTAFYLIPSLDGSREGVYYANTYHAEQRDRYARLFERGVATIFVSVAHLRSADDVAELALMLPG